jgi:hypothetical protein
MVAKLKLRNTKQTEAARFPCCGLPSNHHSTQLLGGSSVETNSIETKEGYQLSQIKELLSRTCGLPYVSSQGYNVVPKSKSKSKSEALGGSDKSVCQAKQVRELLQRFIR